MTDLYPLLFPATFVVFLVLERVLPVRAMPRLGARWLVTGLVFFLAGGVINAVLPNVMATVLGGHTLFDLSALGIAGGALLALALSTLISYWQHRLFHRVTVLWRAAHQLHHAAERVDVAGFAFAHPFELAISLVMSALLASALGVAPAAPLIVGYAVFVLGLFEHLAVATPRWLGVIIQRPEMHAIHHQRGVHHYNYGLPVWDMLFGTYRNPETVTAPAGFWDGASRKIGALLIGKDVTSAPM